MMKTIEERAKEFAEREYYTNRFERERLMFGFYHGATEQRDIDIEKATEWLNANWRKYIDTDADGMIRFSGWKKDFEKAMKDDSTTDSTLIT